MKREDVVDVLTYLMVDFDKRASDQLVDVWFDQFKDVPIGLAMEAARLLVRRKTFGRPRISDFSDALNILQGRGISSDAWASAWDQWVTLARKHGYYNREKAYNEYRAKCPMGARALGTAYVEWFEIQTSDIATFRAQFRDRYQSLCEYEDHMNSLPPGQREMIEMQKQPARVGSVALDLVKKLGAK